MANYYYIDVENVGLTPINDIGKLSQGDVVHVFYSKNNHCNIGTLKMVAESKANVKFTKCTATTKNALDFQLVATIGVDFSKNPNNNFIIISNDQGYDAIIKQFSTIKNVKRTSKITVKKQKNQKKHKKVEELLKNYPKEDIAIIIEGLEAGKDRKGCVEYLQKKYKNKGTQLYSSFRKNYKTLMEALKSD